MFDFCMSVKVTRILHSICHLFAHLFPHSPLHSCAPSLSDHSFPRNQDSSDSTLTGPYSGRTGIRFGFRLKARDFFVLCNASSFFTECSSGLELTLTTHLQVMQILGMRGDIPPITICLHFMFLNCA
jgi:hypothetical protein